MADHDDDLVMESTTDSPAQIAEGLGVDLPDPPAEGTDEGVEPGVEPVADAVADEGTEDGVDEPPIEVTPEPAKVTAPRAPRPQRKSVDTVAAAARRKATADAKVLREENEALRARIAQLAGGETGQGGAVHAQASSSPTAPGVPPPAAVVKPEQVSDEHPEVKSALATLTAAGPRPQQADFDDYDKFEDAKDAWIEKRSVARARVEFVREDVARRATAINVDAFRAGQAMVQRFETAETQAKSRYADYDQVMAAARAADGMRVSPDITRGILDSPYGPDLKYYLAKYPKELLRLNNLAPHRQLAELGKIESRIEAVSSTGQPPAREGRPGGRITRAPEPVSAVLGDRPSVARAKDINDPNISQADYNRLRDQMDEDSGRRPRVVALTR